MFLNRLDADAQLRSDLFIGVTFGDQLEDLRFPRGEGVALPLDRAPIYESFPALLEEPPWDAGAEGRVPLFSFTNPFDQIMRRGLLGEVTNGTRFDQFLHAVV